MTPKASEIRVYFFSEEKKKLGMKDVAGLKILSTAGRKGIGYGGECVKPSVKHSGSMLMALHFMAIAKILSKTLSYQK